MNDEECEVDYGECEADAIRQQTRHPAVDLVAMLQVRRLRWVGHVLRMDESRRLRQVLLKFDSIYPDNNYPDGSVLMNAPPHESVADLIPLAGTHGPGNHKQWDEKVQQLKAELSTHGN